MNEQALCQKSVETASPTKRLARPSHLIGLILILALIVVGGWVVLWKFSGDFFAVLVDPDAVQPVLIGATSLPETADEPVPPNSITAKINQELIDNADHPLDPLLEMARASVSVVDEQVQDYTATIIKRVRWQGRLQEEQFVFCKIRHGRAATDSEQAIPFSVYTRFLKPKAGQEAIWVEGHNDNKLIGHGPPGLFNVLTLHLDIDSSLAMNGNRYSIKHIGMLNLIKEMLEKGERDRPYGDCEVRIARNIPVGKALCTRLEIVHPHQASHFEFHRAEIYIDDQRNLPIAYLGYLWPDEPGGIPKLLERYQYTDIKTNVGLTDRDFDPANEEYRFPGN